MNRILIVSIIIGVLVIAYFVGQGITGLIARPEKVTYDLKCDYDELRYFYRDSCSHCRRIISDGTLEKMEKLGVNVKKFEVEEWGMYGIYATPTFKFGKLMDEKAITGYFTFEQLEEKLGCE